MNRTFAVSAYLLCLGVGGNAQSAKPSTITCEEPANCSHKFIDNGKFKTLTTDDISLTAALWGGKKIYRIDLSVTNRGKQSIDVLPSDVTLDTETPNRSLPRLTATEIAKDMEGKANRAAFLASLGAAMQTQQATAQTTTNGTVSNTTVTSPNYSAQQQTQQNIAAMRQSTATEESQVLQGLFKANTIAPGESTRGTLFFRADPKIGATTRLTISIGGTSYVFPFVLHKAE